MKHLSGKTAFITGGASGIGLGIAQALLAEGVKVAIADVRQDHLEQATDTLSGYSDVHFLRLDVTDRNGFIAAADEAEARLGPVTLLCNNAGVGVLGEVKSSRYDDWDWTLAVNLGGVVNGIQTFLPRMLKRGEEAHIVNTSSIGGMLPMPGGAAYITSKAAVIGLSEAIYSDLAGDGIGVTVLIPGPTASNIHQVSSLRPTQYADSGLTELEEHLAEGPLFPNGRPAIETGRMVVEAICRNQLYLFTHKEFRHGVARRFEAIMTGFEPCLSDGRPEQSFGFPTYNELFDNIITDSTPKQA